MVAGGSPVSMTQLSGGGLAREGERAAMTQAGASGRDDRGGPPARHLRELLRRQFGEVPAESPSEAGSEPEEPPEVPGESAAAGGEETDN
jgi:hypothetical protein